MADVVSSRVLLVRAVTLLLSQILSWDPLANDKLSWKNISSVSHGRCWAVPRHSLYYAADRASHDPKIDAGPDSDLLFLASMTNQDE